MAYISPSRAALLNASVGVSYYTYVEQAFDTVKRQISFSFPSATVTAATPGVFASGSQNLTASGMFQLGKQDTVSWSANVGGTQIASRSVTVAPFASRITNSSMGSIWDGSQASIIGSNYALSFGLFSGELPLTDFNLQDRVVDAASRLTNGHGFYPGTLPKALQVYAYLSDNYSNWMGQLASSQPRIASQPFSIFVLPGAHDAGMNDSSELGILTQDINQILQGLVRTDPTHPKLAQLVSILASGKSASTIQQIVRNCAFTQKDTIETMLALGIRHFDFRPGFNLSQTSGDLFHQHLFVPGLSYQRFLVSILTWLEAHPSEIIAVSLSSYGFASDRMVPGDGTLLLALQSAQAAASSSVAIGDKTSLDLSYNALIQADKRLIFLNHVGGTYPSSSHSVYSDAYETTSASSIISALQSANATARASTNARLPLTFSDASPGLPRAGCLQVAAERPASCWRRSLAGIAPHRTGDRPGPFVAHG